MNYYINKYYYNSIDGNYCTSIDNSIWSIIKYNFILFKENCNLHIIGLKYYYNIKYNPIVDLESFNKKFWLTKITYMPEYFNIVNEYYFVNMYKKKGFITIDTEGYNNYVLEKIKKLQNERIQINKLSHKYLNYLKLGCSINLSFTYYLRYYVDIINKLCKYNENLFVNDKELLMTINFEGIEKFTKLKTLHLKNVYITPDNYEQLSKSSIEKIIIDKCISDDDFKFLSNIKTLKSITFNKIKFKNIDNCADIFKLPLKEIVMNICNISTEMFDFINIIKNNLFDYIILNNSTNGFKLSSYNNNELNDYPKHLIRITEEIINNFGSPNNSVKYVYNNFSELFNYENIGNLFFSSMNECKTLKTILLNCIIKQNIESNYHNISNSIYKIDSRLTNIPIGKNGFYYKST